MTAQNRRARRGSVSWMVGLSMPMLAGFTAMAVDWGMVVIAKDQAQTAADAGAMAAAVHFDDQVVAESAAGTYVRAVEINSMPSVLQSVIWGSWDGASFTEVPYDDANAVMVTASVTVRMPFSAMLGIEDVVVTSEAGAAPNVVPGRAPDTVIVIDVTTSMNAAEIAAARAGAQDLVDCVAENATTDSRASIVLHTGYDLVKLGWTDYSDGGDDLRNALGSVRGCGSAGSPGCSNTNQSAGMGSALEQLAVADATRPDDVGQVVVFFSDGAPTINGICTTGNYTASSTKPWRPTTMTASGLKGLRGLCQNGVTFGSTTIPRVSTSNPNPYRASNSSTPTAAHYVGWADYYQWYAENNEIDIHTVFYYDGGLGDPERAAGITFLRDHVTTHWGDPDLGAEMIVADDTADISDAFEEICISTIQGTPGLLF